MTNPFAVEKTEVTDYFGNCTCTIKLNDKEVTRISVPEREIGMLQNIIGNVYKEGFNNSITVPSVRT
jgi:hypothetical protein